MYLKKVTALLLSRSLAAELCACGQEDYVFGTSEQDDRHWDSVLLEIFETCTDTLAPCSTVVLHDKIS